MEFLQVSTDLFVFYLSSRISGVITIDFVQFCNSFVLLHRVIHDYKIFRGSSAYFLQSTEYQNLSESCLDWYHVDV